MKSGFVAVVALSLLSVAGRLVDRVEALQARSGVTVSFSAATATTLHEPVFVDVAIQNGLAEPVLFDLGHNRKSNFDFIIAPPDGSTVHPPRLSEEGFGRVGRLTLAAGQSYRQRLLLNEWYQPKLVGVHKVTAALIGEARSQSGVPVKFTVSGAFDVDIKPRDPAALSRVAAELSAQSMNASDVQAATEAAVALSYLNDAVAVSFLRQVLEKAGSQIRGYAASGLARVGSVDAVEALIANLRTGDADLSAVIRTALESIRNSVADPALKNRIDVALRSAR